VSEDSVRFLVMLRDILEPAGVLNKNEMLAGENDLYIYVSRYFQIILGLCRL